MAIKRYGPVSANPHRCPRQPGNLAQHYKNVEPAREKYYKEAHSVAVAIDILEKERPDLCFACDLDEAMQVVNQYFEDWFRSN